jgi:L-gulonolactone oxidase
MQSVIRPAGSDTAWRNWAGTETSRPTHVARPTSSEEVAAAVREAARRGLRVKAVGAGHSFTGAAVTDGLQLQLDRLDGIISTDPATGLVTVLAGTPLHRLNPELWAQGLSMTNLGDIDRQTISGAISTGTHGTGGRLGGIATQVRALELVTGAGEVLRCSASERPELFAAARVGIGAFGVITQVTLQTEPAFALHADESPMPLHDVLSSLDELVEGNDHFEFYWFPYTRRALTKRNNRRPVDARQPLGRVRGWVDDELLSNTVYEWVNRLATAAPSTIRRLNGISSRALSSRQFTDASYRVFASPRRVVFREMEYAVPRAAIADVLTSVDAWLERSDERIAFPIEVRFAAADDIWLSTAYERDTAYIAVHQYHRRPHERYFNAVESIVAAVGGRPHWGKLHGLDHDALRRLYPRFDEALAVRREVDPAGVFANPYLDRVLGKL